MNARVVLLGLAITFCSLYSRAQADTIPYKIGKYDVKKQEKVFVIARTLKVDPNTIVKLNRLRNIQQDLVPGQRIKIPVYPKGYVYEPENVVVKKPVELDSAQMRLLGIIKPEEPKIVQESSISTEEASNRLMMIDAMMELNEAMLQGVKASIDTLNVQDNGPLDEKNMAAMLQRMKRSRDKVLLMPYLENLNDSLTTEIKMMKEERERLDAIVNPKTATIAVVEVKIDTIISGGDTILYKTVTDAEGKTTSEVAEVKANEEFVTKDDTERSEVLKEEKRNKKFKGFFPLDTVLVYDLGAGVLGMKPEPEKLRVERPSYPRGKYWDTARAINPLIDTSASNPLRMLKDTSLTLKLPIPNTRDSIIIKPIRVIKQDTVPVVIKKSEPLVATVAKDTILTPSVAKKDTLPATETDTMPKAKAIESNPTPDSASTSTFTVDTSIALNSAAQPVQKPDTIIPVKRQSVGEMAIASGDSIKKIKATFFYNRAQNALRQKNFRNAEQYLEKCIELYPRYYNAWFALADLNALFGSASIALKQYQTCYSIDSSSAKLHNKMGELLLKIKRKGDALKSFSKAIDIDQNDAGSLMQRASIYNDFKQYSLAIADFDRVIQINRSNHFAYKARGQVYVLNHNYVAAIDDFTRYLIFESTDPSAYYYRGLAKIANNELLDGCLDLSTSAEMGYTAASKAIKKSCE